MGRIKGSGQLGAVRSARFPRALDAWFEERLMSDPAQSSSDLLVRLVHGGLRLREAYMPAHRDALAALAGKPAECAAYRRALCDTFGDAYLEHLDAWLKTSTHKTSAE